MIVRNKTQDFDIISLFMADDHAGGKRIYEDT